MWRALGAPRVDGKGMRARVTWVLLYRLFLDALFRSGAMPLRLLISPLCLFLCPPLLLAFLLSVTLVVPVCISACQAAAGCHVNGRSTQPLPRR